MCSAEELEFPQKLFEYQCGFAASKTLFTACELGVFDLLHEVQEPLSAATITTRLSTTEDGMECLLDACVGLKLLKVDLRNNEGFYSNTDVSSMYLVKSSPRTLYYMIMFYSKTLYKCYNFLPEAVREGKCQYERAFGISSEDPFKAIYRSEENMLGFMYFMNSTWSICGKYVVQAFDLSEFNTIYDLGGCTGSLAKQLVSTYKESTVTIMDMPNVLQATKKHFVTDEQQQIHFLEGDIFNDAIPEADLFILARIIHDWTEDKCLKLLKKIYQSCKPGGGVLLVNVVLNEDRSGPLIGQLFSLSMLLQTEGKERTSSEYIKLLTESGFRDIKVKVTGKLYDAILGRK
ncbi:acetylserotonin O-methyltransferase-like isoform X1 [Bufo gargarizans]|uniref:acetylserotonin O-methyltransferase-like isoform X1 n=2 Tax=Bufo gargarizans TaxID=30331 RepID=UPI001CF57967|nr:acetylserotonin O-methyltransferase-like isoform X1 [Bufo gargarizans]